MAEQQNWQRHGPFDLGMHEYMEDFEIDLWEEEFWEVPAMDVDFMGKVLNLERNGMEWNRK